MSVVRTVKTECPSDSDCEALRFHVKLQSFQITNLLYLMRSMCVSLGFSESQEAMKSQEHDSTSLEQKRAFTGVYYLVTMFVL